MTGVQFLTDTKGRKTAVMIDLKKYRAVWEDFYDAMLTQQRIKEPRSSLEAVKQSLKRKGKLRGAFFSAVFG